MKSLYKAHPHKEQGHRGYVVNRLKSILQGMAEFKDMYKIVRFVDSEEYSHQAYQNHPDRSFSRPILCDLYVAHKHFRTNPNSKTYHTARLAEHVYKYIELNGNDINGWGYALTPEGLHLLSKRFYFFRVGLWDESLKGYDKTQTVVVLMTTSLIAGLGGVILGYIIGR